MIKTIGIILLIYGLAGVVGTFIVYGVLRQPLQQLRVLLRLLAEKLDKGGDHAKIAGAWIGKIPPLLQILVDQLLKLVASVRETAKRFGDAAGFLKSAEATCDAVQIPTLTPQIGSLDLSFEQDIISGVTLTPLGEISGFKIYGPPLKYEYSTLAFTFKPIPVLTGVTAGTISPLQPVGDAFRFAGDRVDNAREHIDNAGDRVEQMKERVLETKERVENAAAGMNDFAEKLKEAGRDVVAIGANKLLPLLPALALGYFGLIHLAFALTGLALLLQ